jgi:uncharacterized membrane protein YedE/YeeE
MPALLVAFASGLVFGLGIIVSGMVDPAKVLAFLDLAGNWDPSLAFVMGGAIPIAAAGFILARRRRRPVCDGRFSEPAKAGIDMRLIVGAILFGTGWGLAGYCPAPALVASVYGQAGTLVFVTAMLAGMAGYELYGRLMSHSRR